MFVKYAYINQTPSISKMSIFHKNKYFLRVKLRALYMTIQQRTGKTQGIIHDGLKVV